MRDANRHQQTTLIVSSGGLRGVQIRQDTGEIGFLGTEVTAGLVRPTGSGISKLHMDKRAWQPEAVEDVLKRVRIVLSPGGDWEAVVSDPTYMADIIAQADAALSCKKREIGAPLV